MRVVVRRLALFVVVVALGSCGDAHPFHAPDVPRDTRGRAVDPVYGTLAPGTMSDGGGM
ncbi:MAG TPA: hypothetical protein VLX85_06060 [Stellaceae bacterium]|nr:hypothetical protein [Stellaceae bacterium]